MAAIVEFIGLTKIYDGGFGKAAKRRLNRKNPASAFALGQERQSCIGAVQRHEATNLDYRDP